MFLAETWPGKARVEEIWARYKFGGTIEVSRESKGGCVVVLWKKDLDFLVNTFSPNHIDVIVNKEKEDKWRFMEFYSELDTDRGEQ